MNNNIDKQYQQLLKDIIEYGVEKQDRTGTGTKSIFGYTIRHNMRDGFPLLTTKKLHWPSIVSELLWFLQGRTDLRWLLEQGNTIWVGDCYENYLNVVMYEKPDYLHEKHGHLKMSVKKEDDNYLPLTQEEFINRIKTDDKFRHWGELGPIYGKQWRDWGGRKTDGFIEFESNGYSDHIKGKDQIQNLINDLKTNPDSRRLMVNAWNVGELDQMVLPPCHYGFQVYTRELSLKERRLLVTQEMFNQIYNGGGPESLSHKEIDKWNVPTRAISLMWNQRSVDVGLGLPFNIASYGLLLEIIAKITNMVPDELIGNLGDTHLYLNHIEPIKEQLTREPFELPKLVHMKTDEFWKEFNISLIGHLDPKDFTLENYQSHPTIKLPLSN